MYPTPEAEAAAKHAPNSYLYAIEGNHDPADTVPRNAIKQIGLD
jgi:hypothetical protein